MDFLDPTGFRIIPIRLSHKTTQHSREKPPNASMLLFICLFILFFFADKITTGFSDSFDSAPIFCASNLPVG